jgi:hypothetical protein
MRDLEEDHIHVMFQQLSIFRQQSSHDFAIRSLTLAETLDQHTCRCKEQQCNEAPAAVAGAFAQTEKQTQAG